MKFRRLVKYVVSSTVFASVTVYLVTLPCTLYPWEGTVPAVLDPRWNTTSDYVIAGQNGSTLEPLRSSAIPRDYQQIVKCGGTVLSWRPPIFSVPGFATAAEASRVIREYDVHNCPEAVLCLRDPQISDMYSILLNRFDNMIQHMEGGRGGKACFRKWTRRFLPKWTGPTLHNHDRVTAILYLTSVAPGDGGATWFPNANGKERLVSTISRGASCNRGLLVHPTEGSLVIFMGGDEEAVHDGCPVLAQGVKLTMLFWSSK